MATKKSVTATLADAPVPVPASLTTKHYPIVVEPEFHARLRKPVVGMGGWQTLLRDIQAHTDPVAPVVELPASVIRRMIPYAVKFGGGGYQGVIRLLLCLILEQHMDLIVGASPTVKGVGK